MWEVPGGGGGTYGVHRNHDWYVCVEQTSMDARRLSSLSSCALNAAGGVNNSIPHPGHAATLLHHHCPWVHSCPSLLPLCHAGAAPGAWSSYLAATCCSQVIAVDPAQLHPDAASQPGVHHVCQKGEEAAAAVQELLKGEQVRECTNRTPRPVFHIQCTRGLYTATRQHSGHWLCSCKPVDDGCCFMHLFNRSTIACGACTPVPSSIAKLGCDPVPAATVSLTKHC